MECNVLNAIYCYSQDLNTVWCNLTWSQPVISCHVFIIGSGSAAEPDTINLKKKRKKPDKKIKRMKRCYLFLIFVTGYQKLPRNRLQLGEGKEADIKYKKYSFPTEFSLWRTVWRICGLMLKSNEGVIYLSCSHLDFILFFSWSVTWNSWWCWISLL